MKTRTSHTLLFVSGKNKNMEMMNLQQNAALDLCLSGHNVLITGQAGTGKTFLMTHITRALIKAGKNVQLTCTTGIASTAFPGELNATTVHRWSGLNDGRFEASETSDLIRNSPKFTEILSRINCTQVLIIDEISMLSQKMFEQLEHICASVRCSTHYFGGIQVILSGDFYQLPPVANPLYNDNGDLCFHSNVFKFAIPHHVILDQIIRQSDAHFANIISKVAKGEVDRDVVDFMESVQRPLTDSNSIKLFSNNLLVDKYNRDKLLEAQGDIVEYKSEDNGDKRLLSKVTAQPILWLKLGCPVILLRNLSHLLVNGLRGHITAFETDGPVVEFPTVSVTTVIKRTEFSVYSPQLKRNLATRLQVPLKLSYSLTIHKAQGMTLSSAHVDCQEIFRAGQLGVAIGRVRTVEGLRVTNFHPKFCIPQPVSIAAFCNESSKEPIDDISCCKQERFKQDEECSFTIDQDFEMYYTDPSEEEFDHEFDEIIANLGTQEPQESDLPEDFSLTSVLDSIKPSGDIVTSKQRGVYDLLNDLDVNLRMALTTFCTKEFIAISSIIDDLNISEPVSVKPETLTQFYGKCHEHQISDQYKLNCMLCFKDEGVISDSHWYICYQLTVAVRKFVLTKKEKLYPTGEREITKRSVTDASKARIRYVGGYSINKIRQEQLLLIRQNMYSQSVQGQIQYEKANDILGILNSFREDEEILKSKSVDPDSLLDTIRKQYTNRGLTHVSDEVYHFFVHLCEKCLKLLIDKNLNERAEHLFDFCWKDLVQSSCLIQEFVNICSSAYKKTGIQKENLDTVSSTMNGMLTFITLVEYILEVVTKKFVFVMLSQFRQDLLQSFKVSKTMEHRKQIQTKKLKESLSLKSLNFKTIEDDQTENKKMSHSLLQGLLMKKSQVFQPMTKQQILQLCKAYNISVKVNKKKSDIIDILSKGIISASQMSNSHILNPSTSVQFAEDNASTSCELEELPSTSTSMSRDAEPVPSTSTENQDTAEASQHSISENDDLCKICHTEGKPGVKWIQCGSCELWLHRHCAGLKSNAKWKHFQSEGVEFLCKACL